jgi:hypothetical protein
MGASATAFGGLKVCYGDFLPEGHRSVLDLAKRRDPLLDYDPLSRTSLVPADFRVLTRQTLLILFLLLIMLTVSLVLDFPTAGPAAR